MLEFIQKYSLDDFYTIGIHQYPDILAKVCATQPSDFGLPPDEERGLPGEARYMESGWSKKMMGRYIAAGVLCKNTSLLELCSGLGWGAYILSHIASEVTCLELDENIRKRAEQFWQKDNITWQHGNALHCDTLFAEGQFSAVTFMEAIEHFTRDDGFTMLKKIQHILKDDGVLIASSYFPASRGEADRCCAKNKHHLYIFTEQEIMACCKVLFRSFQIVDRKLLVAVK